MKKLILFCITLFFVTGSIIAQTTHPNASLLWKVTGNDLKEPSYIFGTLHLLSHTFIDTMPNVLKAYNSTNVVAGELIMDASVQSKMIEASMLDGTTLKQILPDSIYDKTAKWFEREADLKLKKLNAINPMTVMTVAMAICQQKYFPNPPGSIQLDSYFQEQAKKDGKNIIGLEDIDAQIYALFTSISLDRQSALLNSLLHGEQTVQEQMELMYKAYISQDIGMLQQLMYGDAYTPEEIKTLLDDRNIEWMKQIPNLMRAQPTFIAVGALHLGGDNGLIALLQKQGYTVVPEKTGIH